MATRRSNKLSRAPRSRKAFSHGTFSFVGFFGILFVLHAHHDLTYAILSGLGSESVTGAFLDQVPLEIKSPTGTKDNVQFKVPEEWNRFDSPWIKKQAVYLKTPSESKHRYLYSPTRIMTSDGIGHSMGSINHEFNLALRLNLTYTHRVGFFSSLSSKNRDAVENFFGWGEGEVPRAQIQKEGCNPINGSWPDEKKLFHCHYCQTTRSNGSLHIKHLVSLPGNLGISCGSSAASCDNDTRAFLQRHNRSHTIFQLSLPACGPPSTDSNMLLTKDLFYRKYWNKHGRLIWSKGSSTFSSNRGIRLDPRELSVAIHVRRGDFLKPEVKAKRQLTAESTFVSVFRDAFSVIKDTGGAFAAMPIAVHIYSEGKLLKERVRSTHGIDDQDKRYYDVSGKARDELWWKRLIVKACSLDGPSESSFSDHLRVVLHISEDTLRSVHEMISADIFIGSESGLSTNLIWALSRGVVLIPHHGAIDNELGKKGELCCSVPFENSSGMFARSLFSRYWKAYAAANGDSARTWTTIIQKSARQRRKARRPLKRQRKTPS